MDTWKVGDVVFIEKGVTPRARLENGDYEGLGTVESYLGSYIQCRIRAGVRNFMPERLRRIEKREEIVNRRLELMEELVRNQKELEEKFVHYQNILDKIKQDFEKLPVEGCILCRFTL